MDTLRGRLGKFHRSAFAESVCWILYSFVPSVITFAMIVVTTQFVRMGICLGLFLCWQSSECFSSALQLSDVRWPLLGRRIMKSILVTGIAKVQGSQSRMERTATAISVFLGKIQALYLMVFGDLASPSEYWVPLPRFYLRYSIWFWSTDAWNRNGSVRWLWFILEMQWCVCSCYVVSSQLYARTNFVKWQEGELLLFLAAYFGLQRVFAYFVC